MIKVVYNACFGGFSLSTKGAERLIELGVDNEDLKVSLKYSKSKSGRFNSVHLDYNFPRHDPRLVQVVEELGEEANGSCAKLRIEEIYSSRYRIKDYDGCETVVTSDDDYDWIEV